jgi:hypothetical protein
MNLEMLLMVEHLLFKCEAQSANLSTAKKQNKTKNKRSKTR